MMIKDLVLSNFRNYENCHISFSPQITVLVGDNAQGKTNILEAIYLLSTGRSHRSSDDQDLIKFDCDFALVKANIQNPSEIALKAVIHPKGKTLFIQNQALRRSSEFIGKLNAVLFSPTDLDLFDASPKARRRLIDVELGKINPFYMEKLSHYNKILKERNAYLKEGSIDYAYLEIMTQQLIDDQIDLIQLKAAFIKDLNAHIQGIFPKLSLSDVKPTVSYIGPVEFNENIKELLTEKYLKSLERDKQFKQTHVGVHRDDLSFELESMPLISIASQGQKRMVVIALKCALLEVVESLTNIRPILLLDDVFSELDAKRREALYQFLHDRSQTLITTTDLDDIRPWLKEKVLFYQVKDGGISERSDDYESKS